MATPIPIFTTCAAKLCCVASNVPGREARRGDTCGRLATHETPAGKPVCWTHHKASINPLRRFPLEFAR